MTSHALKFYFALSLALLLTAPSVAFAGTNLRINLRFDYSSARQDGLLP